MFFSFTLGTLGNYFTCIHFEPFKIKTAIFLFVDFLQKNITFKRNLYFLSFKWFKIRIHKKALKKSLLYHLEMLCACSACLLRCKFCLP